MTKIEVKLGGVNFIITKSENKAEDVKLILELMEKIFNEFEILNLSSLDMNKLHISMCDEYNKLADNYNSDNCGARGSERDFIREKIDKYEFCLTKIKDFIITNKK